MRARPVRFGLGACLLMIALVGCTTGTPSPAPTATPGPTASTAAPTASPAGEPIVVGSSLSLTGALAATGNIHRLAGDLFIKRLNEAGGLLGRPVTWTVLDDASDAASVAALYERLISEEEVDLIMGPYATPLILAAQGVAERTGYVLPQHTAVLAPLMTYECQFPGWSIGPTPNEYVPGQVYDALASLPEPPETIVIVTNESGSTDFISHGPADSDGPGAVSIAEDRGLDVLADIPYPPGNTEWASTATQIRDLAPDFVMVNGLGVESLGLLQAMEQLDYKPPMMFSLFPAPGPLLGAGDLSEGHLSVSMFEPNAPILEDMDPVVTEIVEEFEAAAVAAQLPYTTFETQATASWTAWEILTQGVEAAGGTDDQQAICDALHESGVDSTFNGQLSFDPATNNFWPSTQGLKQIQDGDWVMVWPADRAAAPLNGPAN